MDRETNSNFMRHISEMTVTELCEFLDGMTERIKSLSETICTDNQTAEEIDKAFRLRNAVRHISMAKAELLYDVGSLAAICDELLLDTLRTLTAKAALQEKERIGKAKKIKEN